MPNFPSHIDGLSHLLQVTTVRHNALSHNIANVNTPGYRRVDVDFDSHLRASRSRNGVVNISHQAIDEHRNVRMDGNNVDIDYELGQLNQNALFFQTCSQMLASHISLMRLAIG